MTVLVTGAGGFIGSHLVERLVSDGKHVRGFVHYNARNDWGLLELLSSEILNEVEVMPGDIQDPFAVRRAVQGCSTVFHLASLIAIPYSYIAPQSYVMTNVVGAVNVMQACLDAQVEKVIHTSTSECYGTAQYVPIDEKHPLQGQSPYSASKIGADMIAESYWRSFGLPVTIVRPFNTYGPRQSARAVIPTIIAQALRGDVVQLGSLTPTRDLNYVEDTVTGFLRAAAVPKAIGQVINLGSGRDISIGDLAQLILRILGSNTPIATDAQRVRPEQSEVQRLLCNNAKAKSLLGWEPTVPLEEGVRRTIGWLTQYQTRYKAHLYNV